MRSLTPPIGLPFRVCLCITGSAFALWGQWAFVAPDSTIQKIELNNAGEAQSAIVPPGKNFSCTTGRIVITNDMSRPNNGSIISQAQDIPEPGKRPAVPIAGTTSGLPDPRDYVWGTNDHDLLALPNGDLLLVWGVWIKSALSPKPAWFDYAYRETSSTTAFGPGARSGVVVWRSADCGRTFQYKSTFDPALAVDGTCALPQGKGKPKDAAVSSFHYDMGGSDGQTARISGSKGFLSFACVGLQEQLKGDNGGPLLHFTLDQKHALDKTAAVITSDFGSSWTTLGFVPNGGVGWRMPISRINDVTLAFQRSTGFLFAHPDSVGNMTWNAKELHVVSPDTWGYKGMDNDTQNYNARHFIKTANCVWDDNINGCQDPPTAVGSAQSLANTVSAVVSDKKLLLAFPATWQQNGKNIFGYRVFTYDLGAKHWLERKKVTPIAGNSSGFIMHMGAISSTDGTLLYWTDINGSKLQGRVRGRFISPFLYNSSFDYDVDVALDGNATKPHTFSLNTTAKPGDWQYWYGDYQNAGATSAIDESNPILKKHKIEFFPIWREPGNFVYYTRVTVWTPVEGGTTPEANKPANAIVVRAMPNGEALPILPSIEVDPKRQPYPARLREQMQEYTHERTKTLPR